MAEMEANWREKPTMDAAKDHFEEFVSKRIQDQKDSNEYRAAFAGETQNDDDTIKAERYHFFAPATQLDEFGTGISLYFHTVKAVFVMMAICALISILAIVKNNSFNKQYIPGQTPAYAEGTTCPDLLRGSVYGATRNDLRYNYQGRLEYITLVYIGIIWRYLLALGAANIAIIAILTAFLFIASSLEARSIQKIDQNLQTTKDYAVEMHNPPTLVTDPEEYHKYFSQFGEVVYISVAVRNGTLLRTLADKVVLQSRLEGLHLRQKWKTYLPYLFPSEEKLRGTLSKLQEQIADIADPSKPPFPVYRVFAIFNTQAAKIDCTDKCAISYVDYLRGETSNPLANFHGNLVQIEEPREPSDTLYDSTDSSFHRRLLFSVISYAFCAATIVVSFFIVVSIQRQGASVAVYLVISNSILPLIISVATLNIEIHTNESFRQVSMLLKLFVMRCINSGVLIFLAVNYEAMFGIAHLDAILGSKNQIKKISYLLLFIM